MRTIAIDAMGGENAPEAIIQAVLQVKKELPQTKFILFGDQAKITQLLGEDKSQTEELKE